jgi:glyoxylase-like metal-dependent hydrolase (beta-lactamase superfamily II)
LPVHRISENCLQIRRFNFANCYLVREDDGLTLVDTALQAASIIAEAARYLGQPIRRILLTHAHVDHVGSLDAVKQRVPDAQVLMGDREIELLREVMAGVKVSKMRLHPDEAQNPVKGSFKKLKNLPGIMVKHGDSVKSLRVVSTPGHTPGHLSFIDQRDGALYAGDALMTVKETRLTFDPPWYFPLPKGGTWHFPTCLSSAEKLLALKPSRILAGHGPAVENAISDLENAVRRAGKVLAS